MATVMAALITAIATVVAAYITKYRLPSIGSLSGAKIARFLAGLFGLSTVILLGVVFWPVARDLFAGPLVEGVEEIKITSTNVGEFSSKRQIAATRLVLEDVNLRAQPGAVYLANTIELKGSASIEGRSFSIIAQEVLGGRLSVSGVTPGEHAGDLLIAVGRLQGTAVDARGAAGGKGQPGASGAAGSPGSNGRDGRCGAGMTGDFRSSKPGGNGGAGAPGGNGGPGGAGGNGGSVTLIAVNSPDALPVVAGGTGGSGGEPGKGGNGGPGGRGGSGCSGIGGHQPTRPNGQAGPPGPDGMRGTTGEDGKDGQLWTQEIRNMGALKKILQQAPTTELAVERLREYGRS